MDSQNLEVCILKCLLLVLLMSGSALAQDTAVKVTVARWPQNRTSAISLTLDDAMNTHLDVAGPILRKHHLNGTFFVSTGRDVWRNRKTEWQHLAQDGNELGAHTVTHPCLLEVIEPHSQDYTPEMMEAEITVPAEEITQLLHRHRGLTFAYPCGNMSFGPPAEQARNAALYVRYVSEHSFGARGAGGSGPQNPDELNVLNIDDLGPTDGKDFFHLLALAEPAITGHNWGVYCFHGIGGEWLSVTSTAFEELASYLERHPEIWTATFGDVLRYTLERQSAVVTVTRNSDSEIDLTMLWPLDSRIYDLSLTLKVAVPGGWKQASATANGAILTTKVIDQTEGSVILLEVPPETTALHISKTKL